VYRDHGCGARDGATPDRISQLECNAGSDRYQCDKDEEAGGMPPACQERGALNDERNPQCSPQHKQSNAGPPGRKRRERSLHPSPSRAPRLKHAYASG